jgi:imidazolonepropionase-like amidohydrolase
LRKWVEGGGKAGLGSHGEVQGIGTHWELWMMAAGGMKAHDALRVATIDSAESIGLGKDWFTRSRQNGRPARARCQPA